MATSDPKDAKAMQTAKKSVSRKETYRMSNFSAEFAAFLIVGLNLQQDF